MYVTVSPSSVLRDLRVPLAETMETARTRGIRFGTEVMVEAACELRTAAEAMLYTDGWECYFTRILTGALGINRA